MTEPMLTVAVLAVLWLIVVIPMIVAGRDARAGTRSTAKFRTTMRALSRRGVIDRAAPSFKAVDEPAVTVSGAVSRRPVPAARESVLHPTSGTELSQARQAMMARRRRSLIVLALGLVLGAVVGVVSGSVLGWAVCALFAVTLAGYMFSLRAQAKRDRERREHRVEHLPVAAARDYEVTAEAQQLPEHRAEFTGSVVSIDADDVALDHCDTIDLTGLYTDEDFRETSDNLRRAG